MITFKELGRYGRHGNSLFQIAATIGHAIKHNDSFIFPYWSEAGHFNFPESCFLPLSKIEFEYNELKFCYDEIPYKHNMNLHGYFQSEKYFVHCKDLIRQYLTPKVKTKKIPDSATLHVRRGDYLQLTDCFEILGMDYYEEALKLANAKTIFIFSDDIPWCKKHFIGDKFRFMDGNTPTMDLGLMAGISSKHIMANSSFSWWGSWLDFEPNKMIIAPKKWFGSKLLSTHDTKDLIPDGWIRL